MSIKRDIKWKDMVLTVFAKNSKDEDVVLCKKCLASALSRCAQEVTKTSIPMTAGIQFRGFQAFTEMNGLQPHPTYGSDASRAKVYIKVCNMQSGQKINGSVRPVPLQ